MTHQPRILILTVESWNSRVGANTYAALFSGYSPENVANIFLREEIPDNPACAHYFQISEMQVIKSLFSRSVKTGRVVTPDLQSDGKSAENLQKSHALYAKNGKHRSLLGLYARELIWWASAWKSKELDAFLEDFKPDVIVAEMSGYVHYNRLCGYVIRKTGAPAVGYFLDDTFTYRQTKTDFSFLGLRPFVRTSLRKLAKQCNAFWAITEKTKAEADAVFGIDCRVLTKPIDFADGEAWKPYRAQNPIRMLYAGKLLIGRYDVIREIGTVLDEINRDGERMVLDVYTTTPLTEKEKAALSPYVRLREPVKQAELAQIQADSDVLLLCEALKGMDAKIARLSFSTKLTDYLHSGKCILAVGNADLASMEYLIKEASAVCAVDCEGLRGALRDLASHPEKIPAMGRAAYELGKKNHSSEKIHAIVDGTVQRLLKNKEKD